MAPQIPAHDLQGVLGAVPEAPRWAITIGESLRVRVGARTGGSEIVEVMVATILTAGCAGTRTP